MLPFYRDVPPGTKPFYGRIDLFPDRQRGWRYHRYPVTFREKHIKVRSVERGKTDTAGGIDALRITLRLRGRLILFHTDHKTHHTYDSKKKKRLFSQVSISNDQLYLIPRFYLVFIEPSES